MNEPIHRTISVHTSVSNIKRIDQHAEAIRRSRNSLINEAIEMLLEEFDKENLRQIDQRYPKKKKAGTR